MPKPPRASLPKGWTIDDIDLEKALMLLSLPRAVGPHPDDGEIIEAGIGRYGPFVRHGRKYANLSEVDEVFTIGMNRAVEVLAAKQTRGRTVAEPLKRLGDHPDGGEITVMSGRYGPYVKWEKINATLPRDSDPADLSLDDALALIAAKAATKGKAKGKTPTRKAAAKTPAAKTPTAKTPATKKPKASARAPGRAAATAASPRKTAKEG